MEEPEDDRIMVAPAWKPEESLIDVRVGDLVSYNEYNEFGWLKALEQAVIENNILSHSSDPIHSYYKQRTGLVVYKDEFGIDVMTPDGNIYRTARINEITAKGKNE